MSINNSEAGHCPAELFIETNKSQSKNDQLLSAELVTPNQPSSTSSIQFDTINMIANIQHLI